MKYVWISNDLVILIWTNSANCNRNWKLDIAEERFSVPYKGSHFSRGTFYWHFWLTCTWHFNFTIISISKCFCCCFKQLILIANVKLEKCCWWYNIWMLKKYFKKKDTKTSSFLIKEKVIDEDKFASNDFHGSWKVFSMYFSYLLSDILFIFMDLTMC